jgi:hypothetical protein
MPRTKMAAVLARKEKAKDNNSASTTISCKKRKQDRNKVAHVDYSVREKRKQHIVSVLQKGKAKTNKKELKFELELWDEGALDCKCLWPECRTRIFNSLHGLAQHHSRHQFQRIPDERSDSIAFANSIAFNVVKRRRPMAVANVADVSEMAGLGNTTGFGSGTATTQAPKSEPTSTTVIAENRLFFLDFTANCPVKESSTGRNSKCKYLHWRQQ